MLLIEDIFVYPYVKSLEDGDIIDSSEISKLEKNITFIGSEYSGKTSLSNKLTSDFLNLKYGIIKLNGSDIKEAKAEKLFEQQVKKNNFFYDDGFNTKKILIVDNIQSIKFNDRHLELFFASSIEFYDFVIFFCLEKDYFANSTYSECLEIEGYRIQDFGYRKRDEIYFKWLSVGSPNIQSIDNNDYHQSVDNLSNRVESVIGNNVVDAKPIFILTILQTNEDFTTRNYSMTSLGECYSVLLHSLLSKHVQYDSFDSVISFLSFLSYKLFNVDREYFSEDEFEEWLIEYSKDFIAIDEIKEILVNSHIIYMDTLTHYKFNQQYIFYYCAGKYIADNYRNVTSIVEDICQNLNNDKKANVLIFLVHHARNKDLIDNIILYSSELLVDLEEFDARKDNTFFQNFLNELTYNFEKNSTRKTRQEILESKDRINERKSSLDEISIRATEGMETHISDDESIDKQLKLLDEAGSALRSIQVIGQVLKNRFGSLPTSQIEYAIEQCNTLGFKIVQFFVDSIIMTEDEFVILLTNLIVENEKLTVVEAQEKAKKYVRAMAFNLSYFIVELVAKSISQKKIEKYIEKSCKSDSHKLINLAVKLKLHPKVLPKDYIQSILRDTGNIFFNKLVNHIVYNHLYLYELPYKDLQWVQEKLKIEFKPAHFNKGTKVIGNSNTSKALSIEQFRL